jgi:hypothetical protein
MKNNMAVIVSNGVNQGKHVHYVNLKTIELNMFEKRKVSGIYIMANCQTCNERIDIELSFNDKKKQKII